MPYGAEGVKRKLLAAMIAFFVASPAMSQGLTLVAFGDSLTHGYGLAEDEGFVAELDRWLDQNGAGEVEVINAGVSGDTTAGGLARIGWSLSGAVDAIIVELGANDLLRGLDPGQSRANLDGILAEISARGIPVLLAGMPAPANFGPEYQAEFDAIFPELAEQYDTLLYPNFLAGLGPGTDLGTVRHLLQGDGLHPNAEGVKKVVAGIGPAVLELLEQARD